MAKYLLIFVFACFSLGVFAQVEDPSNNIPTIHTPVHRDADTRGMANPPLRTSPPTPPPYTDTYTPTVDTTPPPLAPAVPGIPADPLMSLFDQGMKGQLGDCTIGPVKIQLESCLYEVRVRGNIYPSHYPDMCSSDDMASEIGCRLGDQRKNAACILNQAMLVGFCR